MPYDVLEKKIKSLPESCFQEVSDYLDTLIIRMKASDETTVHRDLGYFFGCLSEEDGESMLKVLSECHNALAR